MAEDTGTGGLDVTPRGEGGDGGQVEHRTTGGSDSLLPHWLSWLNEGPLRGWFVPLAMCVLMVALLRRFDGDVLAWISVEKLPGDVKRELSAWQQYGQGVCVFVIGGIVWSLDPGRRRRLWDYVAALAVTGLVVLAAKMLIGRGRPKFGDPDLFLGPLGTHPMPSKDGGPPVLMHAWEIGKGISSDLWSMPSSHTAYAVATSVCVGMMYPRLRWLVVPLAAIVAFGRLVFDAHFLTDVLVGAVVGFAVARGVMRAGLGQHVALWVGLLKPTGGLTGVR